MQGLIDYKFNIEKCMDEYFFLFLFCSVILSVLL